MHANETLVIPTVSGGINRLQAIVTLCNRERERERESTERANGPRNSKRATVSTQNSIEIRCNGIKRVKEYLAKERVFLNRLLAEYLRPMQGG